MINIGDPEYDNDPPQNDLDGRARVLCGRVDIGPYEYGIGDHNCDGFVTPSDFAAFPACMTGPDAGPYAASCEAFDFIAAPFVIVPGNPPDPTNYVVDLRDFAGAQLSTPAGD